MNWFNGAISDAINESLSKKLIFLVYAFDADSNEMNELWNDVDVSKLCIENCISIKLEAESDPCNQFKQLYPITCFPTTYLIGNVGGTPIRIISGKIEKDEIIKRLENAVEIHTTQRTALETNVRSTSVNTEQITTPVAQTSETANSESSESPKKNLDDRVAQAKEKLRLIQEKKRREEEANAKEQEVVRRKQGQEVLKQKQQKEEMEMKRLADQKRKEKLEDELAKKRVMERIKQDREDKQKKYAAEKVEVDKSKEAARTQLELAKQQERMAEAANRSKFARIQFKLTDGSSIVNQFEPEQKLDDARTFITNKLSEMNENTLFSMHSTFPKRDYTAEDMSLSLRELQLVPSASILIIPTRSKVSKALGNIIPNSSSTSNGSTSSSVATMATDLASFIFLPFTIIWGIVSSFLGMGNNSNDNSNSSGNINSSPGRASNSNSQNQNVRRRNIGGIHDENGDDNNATYNGNSTQQY